MKFSTRSTPIRSAAVIGAIAVLALTACGEKKTELGQGGSEVTGSAGPAGANNANPTLERCDQPIATVALLENPRGYIMPSTVNLPPTPVPSFGITTVGSPSLAPVTVKVTVVVL